PQRGQRCTALVGGGHRHLHDRARRHRQPRWETAKENAQTSPDMGGRPTPTAWNRPGRTSAPNMRVSGARLMEQAEQPKIDLRTGPSKDTLERTVGGGA